MNTRKLTCIVCPKGCDITVSLEGGKIVNIEGFTCPRGKVYAQNEVTNPMRTVTSTVATEDGGVIPVKTSGAIPKSLVFDAMREISGIVAPKNARIGDVLAENLLNTGANLVISGQSRK